MSEPLNGCPNCGSILHEEVELGTRWGLPVKRRRCLHCNMTYTPPSLWRMNRSGAPATPPPTAKPRNPDDPVIFQPVRCPKCGGKKTLVQKSSPPTRYHKCQDCGHSFKSVEAEI